MNAKFEKFCKDEGLSTYVYGDGHYDDETMHAHNSWQAAISSIEVTPEIVTAGMNANVGPWSLNELVTDPNYLDVIVESILTAAIAKIKEQP